MPGNNAVNDFADAIQEDSRIKGQDNLGMYPSQEQLFDPKIADNDNAMEMPRVKYSAHYGRYNIDRDSERLELERVQNSVLNDGWLLGREEWTTTDEGDTIVTIKWLQPSENIRKTIAEAQVRDELAEEAARKARKKS